jgi:dTMP kinase
MFVTFEGLDLSGKTTQARLLVERLTRLRKETPAPWPTVTFIREPGGTPISERLREILLDKQHLEMTDLTELLLFSASRAQVVSQVIRPALRRGEIVICDRYYDSTTAYQGYGRSLDLEDVRRINAIATARLDPDLTILVDIPVEEIDRRRDVAGVPFDRMESSGRAFYERVRQGYRALAASEPHRCVIIDGTASVEKVEASVWTAFTQRKSAIHQSV